MGKNNLNSGENKMPGKMTAGMTFTIEPILTLGGPEIEIQEDGWTAVSVDGARSAQFEHTLSQKLVMKF
ncbi:mitochondrial, Methionine aminopeptidase 1D [Lucilia cuprina]|nr:mitochondrial, Methionine aminopeptidase 1D [Lucilia cuprina]